MKITIIGAAGVRTPLIVQAILRRQARLGLSELSLMDIDAEHLEIVSVLIQALIEPSAPRFRIRHTTDPIEALMNADFVITTFRVGGIASRAIDERIPLNHGVLGQETTGPGGFAMGMRSIPVILGYVKLIEMLCPDAWLLNFANPAGMLTEAVIRNSTWHRIVGICDTPASLHRTISRLLNAEPEELYLDYFGLNHLGWVKRVLFHEQDRLPRIINSLRDGLRLPGVPFDAQTICDMGIIPNEYLYYYYCTAQAVNNILTECESRGEQVARQNQKLFVDLSEKIRAQDLDGMCTTYQTYLEERGNTYMTIETGKSHGENPLSPEETSVDEGYAGVALDLIESLLGMKPRMQILNIPNQGAITGMDAQDVVEIPVKVSKGNLQAQPVSEIPAHCLELMKQVKRYERLTIEAAMEKSYSKARTALVSHPLVGDNDIATTILNEYILEHHGYFPLLD